jgi:DNA-binding transcriptional LysR family regulator
MHSISLHHEAKALLTIRRMHQLIAVAEERNFTRAAALLGMTQPALSRAIASLEAEAGLLLFERTPTGVVPTMAGEELIHEARRLLGSVALVEHNVRQRSQGEIGKVHFAMGPLAASCMLKAILTSTLNVAPRLGLSAFVRETSAIVEGVLAGVFDFGICSANTLSCEDGIDRIPLASFPMGMFVRSGHPLLLLDRPIQWDDLLPYPRMTGRHQQEVHFNSRRPFGPLETTVECNDFDVLRATTIATDAIWLTTGTLVEREVSEGAMLTIDPLPFYPFPAADIILLRQSERRLGPAAERVIDIAMSARVIRSS